MQSQLFSPPSWVDPCLLVYLCGVRPLTCKGLPAPPLKLIISTAQTSSAELCDPQGLLAHTYRELQREVYPVRGKNFLAVETPLTRGQIPCFFMRSKLGLVVSWGRGLGEGGMGVMSLSLVLQC